MPRTNAPSWISPLPAGLHPFINLTSLCTHISTSGLQTNPIMVSFFATYRTFNSRAMGSSVSPFFRSSISVPFSIFFLSRVRSFVPNLVWGSPRVSLVGVQRMRGPPWVTRRSDAIMMLEVRITSSWRFHRPEIQELLNAPSFLH